MFAVSTVDALYWRAEGLQRWNLDVLAPLSREQGEILWKDWQMYFAQHELTGEQRSKSRHYRRQAHQAHVRRRCGSICEVANDGESNEHIAATRAVFGGLVSRIRINKIRNVLRCLMPHCCDYLVNGYTHFRVTSVADFHEFSTFHTLILTA